MHLEKQNPPQELEQAEQVTPTPQSHSIYLVDDPWTNQHGDSLRLSSLKDHNVVITMIYTACQSACPRLVADMQALKSQIDQPNTKFVLVSIDPENDSTHTLNEFAQKHELNGDDWILLSGTDESTRTLSNVLDVKYRRISPLDFSHSNIITLLDKNGVIVEQIEGLGADQSPIIDRLAQ